MTKEEAWNRIDAIIEKHEVDDVYVTINNHKDYDALRFARKLLEQEPCEDWYDVPSDEITLKQARQAVKDLRKKLSEHLEQESKTGWIPVSEGLPEAGEYIGDVAKYYLVQNEYGDMLVARYTHSRYWEQIYQLKPCVDEIVAWMPLPKPYKAESEDRNEMSVSDKSNS